MYEWTSHQYSIQWIVSSLKSLVYTASSENYSIRFYADPAEDMKFGNFYLKTASRFLKSLFARIIFFLNFFGFLSKLHVKAIIIQYQIIQYQMSCCWKSTWLSLHDLDEVIVKLISFKRNPPPPLCAFPWIKLHVFTMIDRSIFCGLTVWCSSWTQGLRAKRHDSPIHIYLLYTPFHDETDCKQCTKMGIGQLRCTQQTVFYKISSWSAKRFRFPENIKKSHVRDMNEIF